jgi:hypothetical protein
VAFDRNARAGKSLLSFITLEAANGADSKMKNEFVAG